MFICRSAQTFQSVSIKCAKHLQSFIQNKVVLQIISCQNGLKLFPTTGLTRKTYNLWLFFAIMYASALRPLSQIFWSSSRSFYRYFWSRPLKATDFIKFGLNWSIQIMQWSLDQQIIYCHFRDIFLHKFGQRKKVNGHYTIFAAKWLDKKLRNVICFISAVKNLKFHENWSSSCGDTNMQLAFQSISWSHL